jgi:hypothetical protein
MSMRRMCLATLVLAALAVPAISSSPAQAEVTYPWCAYYGTPDGVGGTNCGFVSWQQCMATVSGIGGWCRQNPRYTNPPPRRRHK